MIGSDAPAQEHEPTLEDVERYFQTQDARITYSWVVRAMLEAQTAHRPVAQVYAFLVGNLESLSISAVTGGGPAGLAKEVGREALFSAAKAMLDHPEKVTMEMANALMDEGLREYRENYRLYRKWKSGESLTEEERRAYLRRKDAMKKVELGRDLFADTQKYKYHGLEWEQKRNTLMGKVAELEDLSAQWDARTALNQLRSIIEESNGLLEDYAPYRRFVERGGTTIRELSRIGSHFPPHPSHGAWYVNSIGMEFIYIDPDTSTDSGSEIEIGFWVARTEVSNDQFRRFNSHHNSDNHLEGTDYGGYTLNKDDQPVVFVNWYMAHAFCKWLNREAPEGYVYRLPTDSEWEYACRAGTDTDYSWGNELGSAQYYCNALDPVTRNEFGWHEYPPARASESFAGDDGYRVTAPVASFAPNAWGLYDMQGNASEWCLDVYASDWVQKRGRAVRGGNWRSSPKECLSDSRGGRIPQDSEKSLGLRVILSAYNAPAGDITPLLSLSAIKEFARAGVIVDRQVFVQDDRIIAMFQPGLFSAPQEVARVAFDTSQVDINDLKRLGLETIRDAYLDNERLVAVTRIVEAARAANNRLLEDYYMTLEDRLNAVATFAAQSHDMVERFKTEYLQRRSKRIQLLIETMRRRNVARLSYQDIKPRDFDPGRRESWKRLLSHDGVGDVVVQENDRRLLTIRVSKRGDRWSFYDVIKH